MRAAGVIVCGMRGIMRLLKARAMRAVHCARMLCLLPVQAQC